MGNCLGGSGSYDPISTESEGVANGNVFGVDIRTLVKSYSNQGDSVPLIVQTLTDFLRKRGMSEEGLFRIPGNQGRIDTYKAKFEADETIELTSSAECHDVAGLLKLYFRELPEPLLEFDLYQPWVQAAKRTTEAERISACKSVVGKLDNVNRFTAQHLFVFLHELSQHADVNKMGSVNLATCFAPTILRDREESLEALLNDGNYLRALVKFMIEHQAVIFQEGRLRRLTRKLTNALNISSTSGRASTRSRPSQ